MRRFVFLIVGLLLALQAMEETYAFDNVSRDVIVEPQSSIDPRRHLDSLYVALMRERDPQKATSIANRIRAQWNDSGSATANLLMQWAEKAMAEKRNAAAFDFLDQIIALKPQWAEGWNRRATLNFAVGDYRKSMSDIERVLSLEPRHFGALSGMAAMLAEAGNDAVTLKAWQRVLDIYPADRGVQNQVETLSEKLAGNPT